MSDVRSINAKNDNFRFEETGYYNVIDNGTYYYPAWKHYNRKTNVFCDRCNRQQLKACIGYKQFDLCLWCVDELTKSNYECLNKNCNDSLFINDTLVSFYRPEYNDINKNYKSYNAETIKPKEHFTNNSKTEKNTILKVASIILILYIIYELMD